MNIEELKVDLINKIKLQRSIHSYYEHKSLIISKIVISIGIIFPALLTFMAFSDVGFIGLFFTGLSNDIMIFAIGIFAFVLFIVSVFDQVFGLTKNHESHRFSIEQYSSLLREIKLFNLKCDGNIQEVTILDKYENFNQQYLQISATSKTFTDKEFLIAEKESLCKELLRKEIKAYPTKSIRNLKKKIRKIVEDIEVKE